MKPVHALLLLTCLVSAQATLADDKPPIRLAYIDALSGPFGGVGENALRQFQHAVDVLVTKGAYLTAGPSKSSHSIRAAARSLHNAACARLLTRIFNMCCRVTVHTLPPS